VNEYPTLGDPVRLGVDEDFELIFGCFDQIVGSGTGPKSFPMGRFAVDTDFEVKVVGKDFFAKHVAVMGNSGFRQERDHRQDSSRGHAIAALAHRAVRHARRVPERVQR
jgi:hypothetical protein